MTLCGACVGKPACYRPTMIEATERERGHSFRQTERWLGEREDVGSSHEPRPMAPCQLEMVAQGHALRVSRVPSISSKERKSPLAVGVCVTQPAPFGRRRVFGPSRPPWSQRLCALSAALLSQAGAPRPRSLAAYGGADAPSGRCGVVYQAVATLRPGGGLPSPRLGPVRSHGGSCAQLSHRESNA